MFDTRTVYIILLATLRCFTTECSFNR